MVTGLDCLGATNQLSIKFVMASRLSASLCRSSSSSGQQIPRKSQSNQRQHLGRSGRSLVTRGRAAICHLPAAQPQEVGNSFSIHRSRTLAPFRRLAKLRLVTVLHEKQPVDELPVSRGSSLQTTKPTADGVGQSPVRRIPGHE